MREGTPRSLFGAMRVIAARRTRHCNSTPERTGPSDHPRAKIRRESCSAAIGRSVDERSSFYLWHLLATSSSVLTVGIFECFGFDIWRQGFYGAIRTPHSTHSTALFPFDKGMPIPLRLPKPQPSFSHAATCELRTGETLTAFLAA